MPTYSSADGQTDLSIHEGNGNIVDTTNEQSIEQLRIGGPECVTATISNNRKYVAVALRNILTDVYQYRKKDGNWSTTLLKRLQQPPRALQWEEADDPRYPPLELIITHQNGSMERFPLS